MLYYNGFLAPGAPGANAPESEKQELRMAFVRFFQVSYACVEKYGKTSNNKEVHETLVDAFNSFVEKTQDQLGHLHNFLATS